MNLEKNWESLKKEVAKTWSKLTTKDLDAIKGKKDDLIKVLKEKYDWTKEEASTQFDKFCEKMKSK